MNSRSWVLPSILALLTGCSQVTTPVSPGVLDIWPAAPTPPSGPPPPPVMPGVQAPAGTYTFLDSTTSVESYTRHSRFVLGDDGRFALEYEGLGSYRGTYSYSPATGVISFDWEAWTDEWQATGVLRDDVLVVTYNLLMMVTDFEDARYKRLPNE